MAKLSSPISHAIYGAGQNCYDHSLNYAWKNTQAVWDTQSAIMMANNTGVIEYLRMIELTLQKIYDMRSLSATDLRLET